MAGAVAGARDDPDEPVPALRRGSPRLARPVVESMDGADDETGPIDLDRMPSFTLGSIDADHPALYDTSDYRPIPAEALAVTPLDLDALRGDRNTAPAPEAEGDVRPPDLGDELFGWGR
jgi:hypothetical protein